MSVCRKIGHWLDIVANRACNLCGSATKEGDVIVGLLVIFAVCLTFVALLFWAISWVTGISFWYLWFGIAIIYIISNILARINMLRKDKQ